MKTNSWREQLGEFAPQFAALNDDVLFGEVWAKEEELSARDRSMITLSLHFVWSTAIGSSSKNRQKKTA